MAGDPPPFVPDPEAGDLHVVPLFGREHEAARTCWCDPRPLPDEPAVWVHAPEQ